MPSHLTSSLLGFPMIWTRVHSLLTVDNAVRAIGSATLFFKASKLLGELYFWLRPSSISRYIRKNTWALVTGSSDGIGFGYAQELLARGSNVIIHGRSSAKLERLKNELLSRFPSRQVEYVVSDGQDAQVDFQSFVDAVGDKALTILINNVGGTVRQPAQQDFKNFTQEILDTEINFNVRFMMQLTLALQPILERHTPALLINMGSGAGSIHLPYLAAYSGCKAHNMAFSAALSREMVANNCDIEVMGVDVGGVSTMLNRDPVSWFTPSARQFAQSALRRVGCGRKITAVYFPHWLQNLIVSLTPEPSLTHMLANASRKFSQREKVLKK